MQKPKKYDWKNSNMALFGSDTDKKVKKESARTEPAWQCGGENIGLQIWRIDNFKVTDWPKEQYGEFYSGDSYIVLNTYKEPDEEELKYDVHFWIGKYSTQDEYGTAAYKTVELDTFLDERPVQHREVQGHETKLFKSYFESITLLKGGAESGFNHVVPEAYVPRLFRIEKQQNKQITCIQVSLKKEKLRSDDVFIIDNGLVIYQYNGSECTPSEKLKAAIVINEMKSGRKNATVETLEEKHTSASHPAMMLLRDAKSKTKEIFTGTQEMLKVCDEDGCLDLEEVDGYGKHHLESKHVFIINTGYHVFCWVGKESSVDERKNAISYASNYLHKTDTPWLPISVIAEGKENDAFNSAFN